MSLKQTLQEDMKAAMKGGEKERLGTIRLIMAAIKQREVDERIQLEDSDVLAVLDKMLKQRRESIAQYTSAGRTDLADVENAEIAIIQHYLPAALTPEEIEQLIRAAMDETGATRVADMGKIMGVLKPKLQGRADMALVSAQIKSFLN
jgi:uncharacterized protein YqeY